MRVALIDPSLFTWPYDRELTVALRTIGHEAILFGKTLPASDGNTQDPLLKQHFYKGLAAPCWKRVPPPFFRAVKGISHLASMATLLPTLKKWGPDVIHFQWLPLPAVDGWFLPLLRGIAPLVLTVHDTLPFNGAPGSSVQTMGALRVLRAFDHLIVHTEQGRERISRHVGRRERIARVPHGLLHDQGVAPSPTRAACDPDGRTTFLLFGKIKPYKGVDVLIEALGHLNAPIRDKCRIRIVGLPYMDTEPLIRRARELNVADAIDFEFRFVSDKELTRELDQAAVLIFPYREIEASGVLMAAISRARPVIASRLGLFAELIDDGDHGLLTAPGDPTALAKALERIVCEPGLLDRLAQGMKNLRGSIPRWTDIAHQTVIVYDAARAHWNRSGPKPAATGDEQDRRSIARQS